LKSWLGPDLILKRKGGVAFELQEEGCFSAGAALAREKAKSPVVFKETLAPMWKR
jgi:hypothetical protein